MQDLVRGLLSKKPSQRPSVEQVLPQRAPTNRQEALLSSNRPVPPWKVLQHPWLRDGTVSSTAALNVNGAELEQRRITSQLRAAAFAQMYHVLREGLYSFFVDVFLLSLLCGACSVLITWYICGGGAQHETQPAALEWKKVPRGDSRADMIDGTCSH